jgi:hypothetical protein
MRFSLIIVFLSFVMMAAAQGPSKQRALLQPERNKGKGITLGLDYGFAIPAQDLSRRFGFYQIIGVEVDYITTRNLVLGLSGNFQFGSSVKEDPLSILKTPEGNIVGGDQALADYKLRMRGNHIGAKVGYLFGVKHNRSGILVTLGAGRYRHRISVQDNTGSLAHVAGDYKAGYDRLVGGLAVTQFVGYQHLVRYSGLNWYIGVEAMQGFTEQLRLYDFSQMSYNKGKRSDNHFRFKAGIILPFIREAKPEEIFY